MISPSKLECARHFRGRGALRAPLPGETATNTATDPVKRLSSWALMMRMVCKPGSVPGPRPRRWPFIWARACARARAANPDLGPRRPCEIFARGPYSALLRVGLAVPVRLPGLRWALTPPFHPYPAEVAGRSVFCGAFPRVAPAGRYPAPLPCGARTFLTRPNRASAAIRPSASYPR